MLCNEPSERITAAAAAEDPWQKWHKGGGTKSPFDHFPGTFNAIMQV